LPDVALRIQQRCLGGLEGALVVALVACHRFEKHRGARPAYQQ